MKKLIVVVVCLSLVVAMLAGCSAPAAPAASEAAAAPAASEAAAPAASEAAAPADDAADMEVPAEAVATPEAPAAGANRPQMTEQEAKDAKWAGSIATAKNVFFVGMKYGYEQAAAEYGIKDFTTYDGQDDPAVQVSQFEDILQSGADILLANPVQADPITPFAEKAFDEGLPVIYVDRGPSTDKYLCFLQSDNVELGRMGGQYIVDFLSAKNGEATGKVIELEGVQGASPTLLRGQGFHEIVDPLTGIEVIKDVGNFDQQVSLDVTTNLLQAHDDVQAIFTHNDDNALGAYKALKSNDNYGGKLVGEDGHVCITGIDGTFEGLQAIKAGEIDATMAQNPMTMTMEATRLGLEYLQGKDIPKDVLWELKSITKDNVDDPDNWGLAVNNYMESTGQ